MLIPVYILFDPLCGQKVYRNIRQRRGEPGIPQGGGGVLCVQGINSSFRGTQVGRNNGGSRHQQCQGLI